MRDEPTGIVEDGIQEGFRFAATGVWDIGTEQHVRLPDLVAELGLELLACRRGQQLLLGEAMLLEETVQGGCRDLGRVRTGTQGQFTQQGGAGTVRVFALEACDQVGQLRSNGPRLTEIPARFGSQGLKAAATVELCPTE